MTILRVIPTRRLAVAVAITGLLWLLPGTVGIYAGLAGIAVLAILVAVDWVLLPGKRGILIEREVPPAVGIGDRAHGTYTVRSAWPRPVNSAAMCHTSTCIKPSVFLTAVAALVWVRLA